MRDFVAAAVVSIRDLEGIELDAKLGRQTVEERLSLGVRVERCPLLASSSLRAIDVIAIFVVNVDAIQFLCVDDVDEACGELFLLSKAVVPAVILVTCVISIMIIRWIITYDAYRDTVAIETYQTMSHPCRRHQN